MAFHQTEKCFRRYEKIIATALERYPEPIRFKSKARSIATDSSRCSDAIAAYKRNQWATENGIFTVIEERPLRVWIERDVCVIGGSVNRDTEVQIVDGVGDGVHGALSANPATAEQVKSLIQLLDEGVLTNPIEIPKTWLPTVEEEIEGRMNIAHRVETDSIILF